MLVNAYLGFGQKTAWALWLSLQIDKIRNGIYWQVRWWPVLSDGLGNNKSNSYPTIGWKRPRPLHFSVFSVADVTTQHERSPWKDWQSLSLQAVALTTHVSSSVTSSGTVHSLASCILICNISRLVGTSLIWAQIRSFILFDGYHLWQNSGDWIVAEPPALKKLVVVAKEL